MFSLFFRKNFYDGWDNVMFLLIPNFIIDAVIVLCTLLAVPGVTVFKEADFYLFIWIFLVIFLVCASSILVLSWAECAYKLADYQTADIKEFFKGIKSCVKDGILYGISLCIVAVVAVIGTLYFFKPADGNLSFAGLLSGVCYIWCAIIIFASLFWYPVVRASMHNQFLKAIKKCFIVFFDNVFLCIVLAFYNLFLTLISIIMLGVAPGAAGITLARANAFRLVLKKYDYLESVEKDGSSTSAVFRKKIPWKELLKEDNEANPVRGFKAFVMPWKE